MYKNEQLKPRYRHRIHHCYIFKVSLQSNSSCIYIYIIYTHNLLGIFVLKQIECENLIKYY